MNTVEKETSEARERIKKFRKVLDSLEARIKKIDENTNYHLECVKKNRQLKEKLNQDRITCTGQIAIAQKVLLNSTEIPFENINIDKLITLINSNKNFLTGDEAATGNFAETVQPDPSDELKPRDTIEPEIIVLDSSPETSADNNQ